MSQCEYNSVKQGVQYLGNVFQWCKKLSLQPCDSVICFEHVQENVQVLGENIYRGRLLGVGSGPNCCSQEACIQNKL